MVKPRKTFFQKIIPPKPAELQGYSLNRIMIFGLILPAFVFLGLFLGIHLSFSLGLPVNIAFIVVALWTFTGFAFGTFILMRYTPKLIKYAEVKRKC